MRNVTSVTRGENGVRTLDIQMSGLEYAGWDFFLDVQRKGQKDIWAVEPEALDGDLLLRIPIRRAYLIEDGPVYAQLRASAPDGRIKKSAQLMLHVKCSINSVESAPSPLPSEFAAYEARMVAIRDAVEELFGRSAVPYEIVDFCEGWAFSKDQSSWETVNIPHTCNVSDGMSGSMYRGKAYYRKDLFVSRRMRQSTLCWCSVRRGNPARFMSMAVFVTPIRRLHAEHRGHKPLSVAGEQ